MNRSALGLAALLAGAAAIGFAPIFVRLSEVGPVATGFHRLVWSLPVFAVLAWRQGGMGARPAMAWSGAFFAGDLSVWHLGIMLTSVANATLFSNLAPVFVTLALWLVWGVRPSGAFSLALAISLGGAVLLMGGAPVLSSDRLAGDGLSVLSGVFYAGYILAVGRARQSGSTAGVMLVGGGVGAVILLGVAWGLGEDIWPRTPHGWGTVLALALVSQVGGQGLIAFGLAHVSAALAAVLLLVQPIVAACVAWVLFAEAMGPWELAGAAVVLTGIHLARRANAT